MKTGREFLMQLPPNIRLAWAKEIIKENGRPHTEFVLDYKFESFQYFIFGSFTWDKTKQGHHFWYEISQL
jgi:hypothetical protein